MQEEINSEKSTFCRRVIQNFKFLNKSPVHYFAQYDSDVTIWCTRRAQWTIWAAYLMPLSLAPKTRLFECGWQCDFTLTTGHLTWINVTFYPLAAPKRINHVHILTTSNNIQQFFCSQNSNSIDQQQKANILTN